MEVVAASPSNGSPFHNHDVREWSRLDSLTGVLERARLETDHWTANTATTSHKYNKVVDSRARSGADGNLQQQAKRKLEVFQSQVPGGRIQVVKTQTVSSSRWVNKASNEREFEDLKLPLNPLDLTSEKSKASVGRSVGRRPPSRSRIRDDILSRNLHSAATTNLHRVSRLCHQIHDNAVKRTFGQFTNTAALPIHERENGDGVDIVEIEHETVGNGHYSLSRTKSTSSDDLHDTKKSLDDLEDLEQLQNWRRTSKIRRSLQYPRQQKPATNKPQDLPENTGSVAKIRQDLEDQRRLSTALRGNNVDLDALDQILKSISNSSVSSSETKYDDENDQANTIKQKRNSFVTVESIQAVKDRLRRTSSPNLDLQDKKDSEEIDDGIVTEDMSATKVKSYVFGMENSHKSMSSGTGSLESRSKQGNIFTNRNEDWFSRRKSYGFEQMHNQQETISSKNKSRVESSTDSGICRSTEIVLVPTPTKINSEHRINNNYTSDSEEDSKSNLGNVKKYALIFENKKESNVPINDELNSIWRKRFHKDKELEGTTISIPITTKVPLRERIWSDAGEIKRHSIAVDESKYINNKVDNKYKRTSLAINDLKCDDDNKRSNKKVEFCKTEVHFAADSGRVNIVETDEKPPPTQNFRRRRRNSGIPEDFSKPVLHFGDTSYEKLLFADVDSSEDTSEVIYENINDDQGPPSANVTVNANGSYRYEELKENIENEAPKGILKNKAVKPKPYILGSESLSKCTDSDTEKTWGVKLRPTQKDDAPVWRSTVTVRNTFYDQNEQSKEIIDNRSEFQKLLTQLRPTSKEIQDYKRNSDSFNNVRISSPIVDTRRSSWSVADRIKQVEDLKWTENKGYSTKVNFGEGETTVIENRHPTWPRREEYSKDLKKNLMNKSLVVRIGRNDTNSKHTVCSKTTTNSDTHGTTTTTKITIDLTPSPTNECDFKFPRATIQSFKSPSLIMNTFKNECVNTELVNKVPPQLEVLRKLYEDVHSDSEADKEVHQILMNTSERSDSNSVVSGSWSKMRAFKHISHSQKLFAKNGSHALLEKGSIESEEKDVSSSKFHLIDKQLESDLKYLNQEVENLSILKNDVFQKNPKPLQSAFTNEQLSSPYLVGQNHPKHNSDREIEQIYEKNMQNIQETIDETNFKLLQVKTSTSDIRNNSPVKEHVLRQPKKSEMAYFGLEVSPKTNKRQLDKPDLLQFNTNNTKKFYSKKNPIYENIETNYKKANTFDSSILEELTKAADQILQAVNGYTDEEYQTKQSSEDEKRQILDTISETKSWKQTETSKAKSNKVITTRTKLKQTSSNSSIDSISRECRKVGSDTKKTFMTKSAEQKQRKKVISTTVETNKATTKARRLQRASSREALLQSHGSSSEDLSAHVEQITRKPRLVKKTKTTQLTVTNGFELKKPVAKRREDINKTKQEERVPVIGLPEIRHKTAVSTIRSTAEKVASRERAKMKADEAKKKITSKRDVSKGTATLTTSKLEKNRSTANRDASHRHTSVNKKTNRSETLTKH